MTRIRLVMLGLLALVAFSAFSAVASAAAPEILNEKKEEYVGKIESKEKPAKLLLETEGGNTVSCTEESTKGEAAKPKKVVKTVVTFTGCEASIGGIKAKCNTSGSASGTIVTKELEGEIGFLQKSPTLVVGQDLWPAGRTKAEKEKNEFNAPFVEFECTAFAKNSVKGGVVAELTPISETFSTELTLTFEKGATKGSQKWTKLESGPTNVLMSSLNGGAFEKSNEQTTAKVKFAEKVKLDG